MGEHSQGLRTRMRHKLKKGVRDKFKPEDYLRTFREGQKVLLSPDAASQKGMPHPRYKGKVGDVRGRRGRSYIVSIYDGNKKKAIIARPEHLRAA